jgi:hypothetical protein
MTTGDGGAPPVLLDRWHVDLLVPADADDASVERLRNRMDASLRQWAVGANPGLAGALVRVEQ